MTDKSPLTAERLRHLLHYDRRSGLFTWKTTRAGNAKKGSIAGSLGSDGYVRIKVEGTLYTAHRLAYLYVKDHWPPAMVDHENGVRSDNRWDNLRAATHQQNQFNRAPNKRSTSGRKGVSLCRRSGLWQAQISVNGRNRHLGRFKCPEKAERVYQDAAKALHGSFYHQPSVA
ncbi:HNH endonuclease [Roseinatronobacter sp. S2]|uniref:HNH endonuclease n=1 Tax=Roseinatronobacter sp. S2 TaxID=3035471 RepID=UPI00358F4DFD